MPNPGSPEAMMQTQQPQMMSNKTMIGMLIVLAMMFVVATFRLQIGQALDVVFQFIAFKDAPVLTLVIAGSIAMTLSTIVRGFMQNPLDMARTQQVQSDFQKEFRQARIENNLFKMKKLQELQPQMTANQMKQSNDMMKIMPLTMLFFVPIYSWIWFFLLDPTTAVAQNIDPAMIKYYTDESIFMLDAQMPWCAIYLNSPMPVIGLPVWIFFYTMMTLPLSQIETRIIRYYLVKKELRRLDLEAKQAEIE